MTATVNGIPTLAGKNYDGSAIPSATTVVRRASSPTLLKPGTGGGRFEPIHVESQGYSKDFFLIPQHYYNAIEKVLIPHGLILDRIEKLAYDITEYYKDEVVNLVCILKGSRGFFNHLIHFLNKLSTYKRNQGRTGPPYLEHYVRIKSYENTKSGTLEVISEDLSVLRGKHVLIVEDIIDTGYTLTKFCKYLQDDIQPKAIGVASLLEKRTTRSNGFKGDFVGYSVPDEFVVGFSLDYNELFRDLEHICVINAAAVESYAVGK